MSYLNLAVILSLTATSALADNFTCVLENKSLKRSAVAVITGGGEDDGDEARVQIYKNMQEVNPDGLLADYDVSNDSQDVQIVLSNGKEKVQVSMYLDDTDALGLIEGTIRSSVMSGNVRCNRK